MTTWDVILFGLPSPIIASEVLKMVRSPLPTVIVETVTVKKRLLLKQVNLSGDFFYMSYLAHLHASGILDFYVTVTEKKI